MTDMIPYYYKVLFKIIKTKVNKVNIFKYAKK